MSADNIGPAFRTQLLGRVDTTDNIKMLSSLTLTLLKWSSSFIIENPPAMASNMSFNQETSGIEVAQTYASEAAGKIVLVTGVAIGGIGDAIARAFASGGASAVIITGRDDARLSAVYKAISADYPRTKIRPLKLDLSSLAAIQKAVGEILDDASIPRIDILAANAGNNTFKNERMETVDGLESHFGANHIGHFFLITSLLPKIRAAAKQNKPGATRIITVASGGTWASPIRFSDWNYDGKEIPEEEQPNWAPIATMFSLPPEPAPFEHHIAYGQSKTANILMTVHINKLFLQEGIYSFSADPGYVWSTGAKRELADTPPEIAKMFGFRKNIDQGSATAIVAALDPGLEPKCGIYLSDCQVTMEKCPPWSSDEKAAEKLWKLSQEIVESRLGK